jgi:predicted dehydrogenase
LLPKINHGRGIELFKVGIIGAGAMGKTHSQAYSYIKDAEVIAVSDSVSEKARSIALNKNTIIYDRADDLINCSGVDAVDICLPTPFHKQYTVMAAMKGIHILCEKPIALNTGDAKEMIDAADANGVVLMIGHCPRFSKAYGLLKNCIGDNRYGDLLSLNLTRHSPMPLWSEGNWLADSSKSGGLAMDLHIHDVDLIYYLLGKPKSVVSSGNSASFCTMYEFPGKTVLAEASWRPQSRYAFNARYDAVFEGACLIYADGKITIYEGDNEPYVIDEFEQAWLDIGDFENRMEKIGYLYILEIKYFLECIRTGCKPERLMPQDSMEVLQITIDEIRSARENKKLKLD